ncbi:ABC transporter substrate-binding protein [Rhodobacteraceae bacterium NNCM2]|nr:ABC transporter substrate-binding protein [Coraliihabitans acroporae]
MNLKRRGLFAGTLAFFTTLMMGANAAFALDDAAAKAHVQQAVDEVIEIVQSNGDTKAKARALQSVMEERAAMPQIARFAAGLAWRDMSDDQKKRYTEAFSHGISVIYARRFQSYAGEKVTLGKVTDSGKRGLLVASVVSQPKTAPVAVEWLVAENREGRTVIADIIIEGVSLILTQRDEIAGMLKKHNGDIDALIDGLNAT